ncbi:NYN domain-containing protein [soil metagenome]
MSENKMYSKNEQQVSRLNNYAFIDSQNLNMGIRASRWRLDYAKFRQYLESEYSITKAYVFIGLVEENQELYTLLEEAGFIMVYKPTISYTVDGKETVKGNVDADLVLHAAAIEYPNYDKAIIVSGDGDFASLIDFLIKRGKLLHLLVPHPRFSRLLRPFEDYIVHMNKLRRFVSFAREQVDEEKEAEQLDEDESAEGDLSKFVPDMDDYESHFPTEPRFDQSDEGEIPLKRWRD